MSQALPPALRIFLLLAAGALVAALARPLLDALAGPGVPAMWWAARALGLLAMVALFLSVLFGMFVSERGGGGLLDKGAVIHLHGRWALAAEVATVGHVLAVVVDPWSGVTPLAALVPATSATLTGPIALGTFAVWGLGLLVVTTAIGKKLSRTAWRAVHATAFGTFVLALVHGITAGSDLGSPVVRGLYLVTAALLVGAVAQRLLLAAGAPAPRTRPGEPP